MSPWSRAVAMWARSGRGSWQRSRRSPLAERIGLSSGATTRLIDRLEQAGYVRRLRDPDDRRRVIVEAVPERSAEIQRLFGPSQRRLREILQSYPMEQLEVLFDYFTRTAPAFRAAAGKMRAGS